MTTAAEQIARSDSLLDIMIRLEDFIDSLDIYAYKNWIDGEIVDGPDVSKYWAAFTLMFDYDKMPDPTGGLRLMKHGALVKFREEEKEDADFNTDMTPEEIASLASASYGQNDQYSSTNMPPAWEDQPLPTKKVWLVTVSVPRRFIDDAFNMDIGLLVTTTKSKAALLDKSFSGENSDDAPPPPATNPNNSSGMSSPGE